MSVPADAVQNFWGAEPEPQENPIQSSEPTEEDLLLDGLNDDEPADVLAEPPAEKKFTVVIDGKELEVTEADLKAEYQKGRAADVRLQEAAELQKEVQQHKARYLQSQAMMDEAIQQLSNYIVQFQAEAEPNWQELLDTAPHEYLKQRQRFEQKQIAMQQAQQYQQLLVQAQQQEQAVEMQSYIKQESEKLTRDIIPEWQNKEVRKREQGELVQYLEGIGYTQDEIVGLSYSRANNIAIARKAMLYDRAIKKAKEARTPRPEAAQPVPTVGDKGKAQTRRSINDPDISYEDFVKARREQIKRR